MTQLRRLGILQCGHAPDDIRESQPDYDRLFERLLGEDRFYYLTFRVVDGQLPTSLDDADAWLISGSRHGVYENHAWIPPLEAHVRRVHAAGQPIVGICFGHQLLAQALGGRVEPYADGWSIGRVDYQLDDIFGANDAPLLAFHQDQVVVPPPGAQTIGTSPFCRHAALLVGERTLGLQPHPEFDDEFISDLLRARRSMLPAHIADQARDSLGKPLARQQVGKALADFLMR